MYEGQALGEAVAEMHSQGKMMYLTADSTVVGAKLNADWSGTADGRL